MKRILYDMGNFFMPTDQVMAFLCFISDNQSVDMSGQVWGGGIEKNKFVLKWFLGNFKCF